MCNNALVTVSLHAHEHPLVKTHNSAQQLYALRLSPLERLLDQHFCRLPRVTSGGPVRYSPQSTCDVTRDPAETLSYTCYTEPLCIKERCGYSTQRSRCNNAACRIDDAGSTLIIIGRSTIVAEPSMLIAAAVKILGQAVTNCVPNSPAEPLSCGMRLVSIALLVVRYVCLRPCGLEGRVDIL